MRYEAVINLPEHPTGSQFDGDPDDPVIAMWLRGDLIFPVGPAFTTTTNVWCYACSPPTNVGSQAALVEHEQTVHATSPDDDA